MRLRTKRRMLAVLLCMVMLFSSVSLGVFAESGNGGDTKESDKITYFEPDLLDRIDNPFVVEDGVLVEYLGAERDIVIPAGVTEIGEEVFKGKDIVSVTMTDEVTTIGDYAFAECHSLHSITWGKNVTTIGNFSFYHCTALNQVSIPESVVSIGDQAFDYCIYLDRIYFSGTNLKHIGYCTFNRTQWLANYAEAQEDVIVNNIFVYGVSRTNLVIPDGITSIAGAAFYATGAETLRIPDSVKEIGQSAFDGAANLKTVNLGSGVEIIGDAAFRNTGLTSVIIPDSVKAIGIGAFAYISELNIVTLGKNVETIGNFAFDGTGIKSITLPDSIKALDDEVFQNCASLTDVSIPTTLKEFGWNVFKGTPWFDAKQKENPMVVVNDILLDGTAVTEAAITIPEGVTKINYGAFWKNWDIQSVVIPDSVKVIDDYAFTDAYYIKSIDFGEGVEEIGFSAFENCSDVTELNLPESLTKIDDLSFYGNSMETLVLPKNLTSIGDQAFGNSYNLTNVTGESITYLGMGAFESSYALEKVTFPNVTYVGDRAFKECFELGTVAFSDLHYVGDRAFEKCYALVGDFTFADGCIVGDGAFLNSENILNLTFQGGIDTKSSFDGTAWYEKQLQEKGMVIAGDVFVKCTTGGAVTVPEGVTTIWTYAFSENTSVTNVTLPESLLVLGDYAFEGCTTLTSINIPEGFTELGDYVFHGCISLTDVTVPDSVTGVGMYCFADTKLKDSSFVQNLKYIETGAFKNVPVTGKIVFHEELEELWAYAFSGTLVEEVVIPDTIGHLQNCTFANCEKLTKVTLPEDLQTIEDSTFENCALLEDVVFPDTLTKIGYRAFYGCAKIKNVLLPKTVEAIWDQAFEGCTGIVNLTLPVGYISIGAFRGCANIENITFLKYESEDIYSIIEEYAFDQAAQKVKSLVFPDNLWGIGDNAFNSIKAIEEITLYSDFEYAGTENNCFGTVDLSEVVIYVEDGSFAQETFGELANTKVMGFAIEENVITGYVGPVPDTLEIPDTVTGILEGAFVNADNLKQIKIPDSVTAIGENVFSTVAIEAGLTICANEGSYAQQYAESKGIAFYNGEPEPEPGPEPEPDDVILGDINGDTQINASDALEALKSVAGLVTLTEKQLKAGDVVKDGTVNANDALSILKYAAGMITEF